MPTVLLACFYTFAQGLETLQQMSLLNHSTHFHTQVTQLTTVPPTLPPSPTAVLGENYNVGTDPVLAGVVSIEDGTPRSAHFPLRLADGVFGTGKHWSGNRFYKEDGEIKDFATKIDPSSPLQIVTSYPVPNFYGLKCIDQKALDDFAEYHKDKGLL